MTANPEGTIGSFSMRDGAQLYLRRWGAAGPRGAVVVIHGIRSHSGWYVGTCGRLADAGYEVAALDRRGAGLNKAQRGDAGDHARHDLGEGGWADFADDLGEFIGDVRHRLPGLPVHLVAISWGAKLAAASCIRNVGLADSLSLVCPGLAPKVDLGLGEKLRVAAALVTNPRKLFDVPLGDARLFTDNPERIAWIENDPLSLRQVTARFLYETRRLDRFVLRRAGEMRVPTLMMLAGRDRIVDNDRTRAIFSRFSPLKKEEIVYPDAAHTLEFEPDPEPMRRDLLRWLDERSGTHG